MIIKRNNTRKTIAICILLTLIGCNTAVLQEEKSGSMGGEIVAAKTDTVTDAVVVAVNDDVVIKESADTATEEPVAEKVFVPEPGDTYVGSIKCKECHEDTYKGWENTLHSRMVQDVKKNPALIQGDFSKTIAKKYADKHEVTSTVGSHWMQRYLTKIKDDYYVMPITWSIVTRTWTENKDMKRFWKKKKNAYSKKCIGCHTTNYNPVDKSYTEHQVGCESCHGPGYEHVQSGGEVSRIVNPAKLSDKLRDMVCAACHVKAEDKTLMYSFPIGFKPGENLADYLSVEKLIWDHEKETEEDVILREFNRWKEERETPRSCDVCGVDKPSEVPVHLIPQAEKSADFCFGCHDFKERLTEHTRHYTLLTMKCDECHKRINGNRGEEEKRNIHSYDYYMIHKTGCYDPFIEKSCIKCHNDKTLDWATSFVIDWSVPANFAVHDKTIEKEDK